MAIHFLKTEVTKTAFAAACIAHCGQIDKAGEPYIRHPLIVASQMPDELTTAAALLHDVIEDTAYTAENLLSIGIPQSVINVVLVLTRRDGESYFEYIDRIKTNEAARCVKLADLRHNSDLSRLPKVTVQDERRREKYLKAIDILLSSKRK